MLLTWSFLRTRQRGVQLALVPFKDCGVTYYAYVVLCEGFLPTEGWPQSVTARPLQQ